MQLSSAPAQLVEAWATGDATKTHPIPVPSQEGITPGAASYTDGFPPLCATPVASGGIPPSKADMNGILYGMSAVDVWMCAGGGFPYNSAFSAGITALTGDVSATGPGSAAATLAASGVTAGSYIGVDITVDAKGRVIAAASGFSSGNNANGYWVQDPTGHIHQWGSAPALNNDEPTTFSFPLEWPNACTAIVASDNSTYASIGNPRTMGCLVVSRTQFTIESGGSGASAFWMADGN
jgi:hypothetical protein